MSQAISNSALDFVTALPVDECFRLLKHGARRTAERRLSICLDGERLRIESVAGRIRRGQTPPLWLFRFEGELTTVTTGTRVCGAVVRNTALDSVLSVPGIVTLLCAVSGIVLKVMFVSILSTILLALFGVFYWRYTRLLNQQAQDLLRWIYEWLTVPQGRAGGPL